jgi:accessory gene regulator protein AgrB
MLTFRVFWRRLRVLKFGTAQSKSIRCSRLSTKPVVCLSAMPNNTLMVRQVWIAASL